ncbi:MAG: Serine/threonine protein kinase PrkC, regulator of stationary phase [Myxococcaceae bacterium]|nr:Serine/threonine protein kinase PrkC, regulator of stationary phase [Myxococcaceae bacterium]MEA2746427.1 eukaryotic-like serine/threonine-protein kinase [Myxococcales bacterium]
MATRAYGPLEETHTRPSIVSRGSQSAGDEPCPTCGTLRTTRNERGDRNDGKDRGDRRGKSSVEPFWQGDRVRVPATVPAVERQMDRIGEYLVKRLIGEGGMGKVYEAEERLSKRRVALKVLRPELTRHEDGRRLFLNEMQILAHLEHPNLVRSLASMETDGQLVLVLEYLHGRTLRQELTRRGTLPWHEALEHVVRIAEALAVAHEQEPPIVHRDLKPENVMLTAPEGGAEDAPCTGLKVMDFGIAKVLEGMHGTNTQSIGTLQYMSPEQIDARTIDARSDLYSLGLIFYEMLCGDPPFNSPSPRELLNLQCTAIPPGLDDEVRKGLPRGVEDLLFAMLEKKPDDRPASAREVVERLSIFRAASDVAPGRPSRGGPPRASRSDAAPHTPRMPNAPANEGARAGRSGDTQSSGPAREWNPAPRGSDAGARGGSAANKVDEKPARPRTDTVALVEQNASRPREVPTWLAVVAIVALSLVAGMTTYLVRMRTTADGAADPGTTTTASAAYDKAAAAKPRVPAP